MRIIILFLFGYFLSACCDERVSPACDTSDPTQLPWLREKITEIESNDLGKYMGVMQADYFGKTVFYITNCCPFCLSTPPAVYDCEGNELFQLSGARQVTNAHYIWTPSDFECSR